MHLNLSLIMDSTTLNQNNLRLVHWNCRSFQNKIEFKRYISTAHPDIVALQETWYKDSSYKPNFPSYTTQHKVRGPQHNKTKGGGLAFIISNCINYRVKTLKEYNNPELEVQCITIQLKKSSLDILNVYAPPGKLTKKELIHYKKQLNKTYIICGDFNAHHPTWDPENHNTNKEGIELNDILNDDDSICIATPPGLITHTCTKEGATSTSTLDLTLCNPALLPSFDIKTIPDYGSDHDPVIATIEINPNKTIRGKRPRWKLENVNWQNWKTKLEKPTNEQLKSRQPGDLEKDYKNFTSSIQEASEETFKKTGKKAKYNIHKPWWNEQCSRATALRRRAKKRYQRNKTPYNRTEYKKRHAEANRTHKYFKKQFWVKYVSTINSSTKTGEVWTVIKKMSGKHRTMFHPIQHENSFHYDKETKAKLLAKQFQSQMYKNEEENYPPFMINKINDAKEKQTEAPQKRFSLQELANGIKNLKTNKSYGTDDICNEFIHKLPKTKRGELLGIYNRSWQTGKVPAEWKTGLIIPILKPGKNPETTDSYRPITLLQCIGKLMENMVAERLKYIAESEKLLPDTQHGFRCKRSTIDPVLGLEKEIRMGLVKKQVTVAVFFDLKAAFDSVDHTHLLYAMAEKGIHGCMLSWIEDFLSGRKICVQMEDIISESLTINKGVPQGSGISTLLFLFLLSTLPNVEPVNSDEFADDVKY